MAEKVKQIPEKVDSTFQQPEIKVELVIKEEIVEEYERLEQMGVTELMQEAMKDVKVEVPATLAIPAPAKPVMTGEKVSTLDDYEPVQQFGMAMLRGRGSTAWKCSKDGSSSRRGRARVRGGSTGAPPSTGELEPEVAAAVPRGGSTRGRRVRVRGGCSRASVAPALREGAVQVARGGAARGRAAQAGRATGSDRTGPRTIEGLPIYDYEIDQFPPGQGLESPMHPRRKRQWEPSAPSPRRKPAPQMSQVVVEEVPPPSPPPSESQRHQEFFHWLSYGSESDSGESDDDDMTPYNNVPRAQRSVWETPLDMDDADDQPATDAPADASTSSSLLDVPPSATDQPWGLYEFDWKPFPNVPIPPESRREMFSHNDVGPTAPCVDPYEIFLSIWDRQFMEYIASETNRYAQQMAAGMLETNSLHPTSRINKWRETNADELYVFFGLVIAMGVVVKSRVDEYWNATPDVLYTPGFSAHMSAHRFALLRRCLHFVNNETMCDLELDASEAKIFKVQPLLSHLNNKFQSLYRLGQNIALDESLLQWKGSLDINQLIPSKAASVNIKTYEICESHTGYLWRFEVHSVRKSQRSPPQRFEDPMKAFTPATVLRLTSGLEGRGHTLWMDNFYNSPCLARRLKALGFDCAGTLRTNREFVPQALHSLTKGNMWQGQITGLTSGDVDVMVWRDNNRVAMISTYHGNGVSRIRDSTKPILIHDYNIMMGGVDKKDQMLAMFPVERKRTKVWYKKLFRRLLNVSVLNAYIIHRQSSSSSPLSHRNFRICLLKALLSKHCSPTPLPATPQILHETTVYEACFHRLAEYPFGSGSTRQRRRRKCVNCGNLVQTYCVGCSKTMCIDSCFLVLHSK